MANIKYFSGDQEITSITYVRNEEFAAKFPGVKGVKVDGYSMLCGWIAGDMQTVRPVERKITYKSNPSRHECNAKCMGGRINGTCECSCGGKNHGVGGLIGKPMASILKAAA